MSKQWVVVRMHANQLAWPLGQWTCDSFERAVHLATELATKYDCRMRIFEATHDVVPGIVPPTPPPTIVRLE